MIKLVLSDLDGTLNDMQENEQTRNDVSQENLLAINKLKAHKIEFGIVTGNNLNIAKLQTIELTNKIEIFATQNGSFIIHNDHVIYKKLFDQTIFHQLLKYFEQNNLLYVCEDYENEYVNTNVSNYDLKILKKLNYNSNLIIKNSYLLTNICKIQVKCVRNLQEIKLNLVENFPQLQIVQGDNFTIDIMSKHSTKADAIIEIAKLLKLNLSEIAYFGDNENDISAFNIVENSFIMSSAKLSLHQFAKYNVKSVAQGIEIILENNLKENKI